jgi:hypothetical protein
MKPALPKIMKLRSTCSAILITGVALVAFSQQDSAPLKHGIWSSATVDISGPARIPSTNGHYIFVIAAKAGSAGSAAGSATPDFFVEHNGQRLPGQIMTDIDPEMAWAPDSKAFFITSSDGGSSGSFGTSVYFIDHDNIREVDINKQVRDDIAARYPACVPYEGVQSCTPEQQQKTAQNHDWVNVAGMTWLGSKELLVIGNVPNKSAYGANINRWLAYRIDARSGKILHRYSEKEFRHTWNNLKTDWD